MQFSSFLYISQIQSDHWCKSILIPLLLNMLVDKSNLLICCTLISDLPWTCCLEDKAGSGKGKIHAGQSESIGNELPGVGWRGGGDVWGGRMAGCANIRCAGWHRVVAKSPSRLCPQSMAEEWPNGFRRAALNARLLIADQNIQLENISIQRLRPKLESCWANSGI